MGRKTILVDDLDGKELPGDTKPVTFTLGRTTYNLYLSDENHGKFLEALNPYIDNAETVVTTERRINNGRDPGAADKKKMKAVRKWAQSTGYKFTDAQGNTKTVGDRGRIPDEVVAAYDSAN